MPNVHVVFSGVDSEQAVEAIFPHAKQAEEYLEELEQCQDSYGPEYWVEARPLGRPDDRVPRLFWICRIDLETGKPVKESFVGKARHEMASPTATHRLGVPALEAYAVSYVSQEHADEQAAASYAEWLTANPDGPALLKEKREPKKKR